ncbi:pyroglutamyl-peptidase I [Ancylobacter lacus]|uniref:pyroglutamyl-peptidase I family protein n=1 Tax=Ancylobacter lacus TaxID=2579970 RepID=UPI001BCBB184|nr:peptidase C15 [Ancylobacter lacus]MBS7539331.1 peptidase C15 [Ancylobacter lacus]
MKRPRVLITGFGRFPGAPVNPSAALALRLARSRRPGPAGADVTGLVLPTEWAQAQSFPDILDRYAPDIVLMIGLAARRSALCLEIRARNGAGGRPDVVRRRPGPGRLQPGGPPAIGCRAAPMPLLAALRGAGLPARLSRDAGGYVCNALALRAYLWAAKQAGRRAIFVHIPRPRPGLDLARMARGLEGVLAALMAQARAAIP